MTGICLRMVNPTKSTVEIYNYIETTVFISQIGELSRERNRRRGDAVCSGR